MSKELLQNKQLALQVLRELRERRERPVVLPDANMVWVLSGPGTVLQPPGSGLYAERLQDLERIQYGINAIRAVTANRLGKKPEEVTQEDIAHFGPPLFYNGESMSPDIHPVIGKYPHIEHLLEWAQLPDFPLPLSHLVISAIGTGNTPDQIFNIAEYLREHQDICKIVVVTHAPHSRRVSRYLQQYIHLFGRHVEFYEYAVPEREIPVAAVISEVARIVRYEEKGDLAAEPLF